MENKRLLVYLSILILVISSATFILTVRLKLNVNSIPTQEVKVVENRCAHKWELIDSRDTTSILSCNKCGELRLIDHYNKRIKVQ